MPEFMILRLRAPLMSFGDVAVDEIRPTDVLPGLSMLTGLLANAMGYRTSDRERLERLQERLVFGSRREKTGENLRDYQNAQVSSRQMIWRTQTPGPLERTGAGFHNVQRYRHYLADAAFSVVFALDPAEEPPVLDTVAAALERPARPLFLGRFSCIPAEPLYRGERVRAQNVRAALESIQAPESWDADGDFFAEWPLEQEGPEPGAVPALAQRETLLPRYDQRDWNNDIHTGSRLVVRGVVKPAGATMEEQT